MKVPKEVLPRFLPIGDDTFVPLEAVIARHLDELFPGMEILRHDFFRVTRDADFTVSDEADDLLRAVEDELRRRRFGEVVRLEVGAGDGPRPARAAWSSSSGIEETPGDRRRRACSTSTTCGQLHGLDGHRELRDAPWTPVTQPALRDADDGKADVFAAMRAGDLLVHHPYDSFAASVERLVEQAVDDPDVLAIKMTVYRTSDDSALVPPLIEAAERGKQAVCLVELKARFDERRNIGWARSLEEAGAHVVHGLPGLKTHAKALLVVRREGDGRAPLRARRHRQLPRQDRAPVRGLRPVHHRPRDRRRRGRAVQRAHRRARARRATARRSWRPSTCATGCSTEIEQTVEAHERGRGGAHRA